ncbi:8143_t:CDS:2, partial [Scutellospora calospora]
DEETNQQDSTSSIKDTEPVTSQTDKILENSTSNIEDLNSENLTVEKENTDTLSVRTLDNSNKENITTKSIQAETAIEIEDSNLLRTLIQRKNKKDISEQKEELTRVAPYRKTRNG